MEKELIQSTLLAVCNWVKDYNKSNAATPRELYLKTKYGEYHDMITEGDIEKILQDNIGLIDLWETFSMDKRWSPSWYFTRLESGKSEVGYYHHYEKLKKHMLFDDEVKACAFFIKMEMEDFRKRNG